MKTPCRIEEIAEGLRATIPASEEYVVLWALGAAWALWLLLGACLFDELGREISAHSAGRSNVLNVVCLAVPALALAPKGLRAFSSWGWSVYGEETLSLGGQTLTLALSVAGVRRVRTFRAGDARKLRLISVPHALDGIWPAASPEGRPARCAISFESGGAEIRFAQGLGRSQAETLVKHLIARCPGLGGS